MLTLFAMGRFQVVGAQDFLKIEWSDLQPAGYDPLKGFDLERFRSIKDTDPVAIAMMDKLRSALDESPPVRSMDRQRVMIPGYVVPLEGRPGNWREFLLVPYFGACIHTPPPPANQIVHVVLTEPDLHIQLMSAIWVKGTLRVARSNAAVNSVAASSYRLDGTVVGTYRPREQARRLPF